MPAMQNRGGDSLARGAVSFTFRPMGENISKEQWAKLSEHKPEPTVMAKYKFKCPIHGEFKSDREFVLSGDGFPKENEYAFGKCPQEDCGEKSEYAGHYVDNPSGGDASTQTGTSGAVAGKTRRRKK